MSFREFQDTYIDCILWSSLDDDGSPLDRNYSRESISEEMMNLIKEETSAFYAHNAELWDSVGMSDDLAGHYFWLTRNRHGSGFWSCGREEVYVRLMENSHEYGEQYVYVGDDNQLYI